MPALSTLPVPSLRIRGFRAFDALDVPRLAQVTLLTGDNHVGKTTLLEAVEILEHGRSAAMSAREVLARRGEYLPTSLDDDAGSGRGSADRWSLDLERLHHTADDGRRTEWVEIGRSEADAAGVRLRAVWARLQHGALAPWVGRALPFDGTEFMALEQSFGGDAGVVVAGSDGVVLARRRGARGVSAVYGRGGSSAFERWDEVTLTPAEGLVVSALQAIDPGIEGIAAVERRRMRSFNVRLRGTVRPLTSMGDGVARALEAALAIATSTVALIDEVDAGVHHRRQVDLWRVLFRIAESAGTQVLATTHSSDTIRAFAAASAETAIGADLVHLQRHGRQTRAVVFDRGEVHVAADEGIELR